ncbi:NACHT domain-containing protein [Glycomyces xiaoerkulensis]|uniref:NACHT domain-containing protein n=1 Tax=Glycomyces xiaoerkulensis TaxID=2038139 RepID=UPI000C260837|nr:ATP-binding protein [Glycomyces xiaoerkulensis]
MSLRATHRGYAYQDLVTGIALVDLMLGTASTVTVDTKGFDDDRFDDLTILSRTGRRTRLQVKHTADDRELTKATFSGDRRSLRLDRVFTSALKDLADHPQTTYRIVVRDGRPDGDLAKVLRPITDAKDPGDPFPGFTTTRYRFDPQHLRESTPWCRLVADLSNAELRTVCSHLTVDTAAPDSSQELYAAGPAELVLLRRATEELGAGRPPNTHRSPEDVAQALIIAATASRSRDGNVTKEVLAPRLGLDTDFGAVREGHPVEPAVAIERPDAIMAIGEAISQAATTGGRVVIAGGPGVGKSWLCEQLADAYRSRDWIVARHHCWLGASDTDRDARVLSEVVLGSLLHQLEETVPQATIDLRPRYAATIQSLATALKVCRNEQPDRNVLLIVDGLDHVDRVKGRQMSGIIPRHDPSRLLIDQLAAIALPAGVCMLIASQPGEHLDHAHPVTGQPLPVSPMSWEEIHALAGKHRLFDGFETEGRPADSDIRDDIVKLLFDRSAGNPLYATYLCRDATRISSLDDTSGQPWTSVEIIDRLRQIPDTATDLDAYYAHLVAGMTETQQLAVGVLAVCDFALTIEELGQVVPPVQPFLAKALATLGPVLHSQPGLGGLKVHHESFSRYVLRDHTKEWITSIRSSATEWLSARGFFTDSRAFRHLPGLLVSLGRFDELKNLFSSKFVTAAIQALQPPGALLSALEVFAHESARRRDWPSLIACVELRRAVDKYETESLPDTLIRYADVVVSILGAEVVTERLLYEGRTTFPTRWGLQLCAAVDRAGESAPWHAYLAEWKRQGDRERVQYGADQDAALHLAIQLGHLRLRSQRGTVAPDVAQRVAENLEQDHTADLASLVEVFVMGLEPGDVLDAANAMSDTSKAARVLVALADLVSRGVAGLPPAGALVGMAQEWAPAADPSAYLKYGIAPEEVLRGLAIGDLMTELDGVTRSLLEGNSADAKLVDHWLHLLRLTHALDPSMLMTLQGTLAGAGFYRAWLRFAVATVGLADDVARGVSTKPEASTAARAALEALAGEATPFTGTPRACDLWSIHALIHDVIERALVVVEHVDLDAILDSLIAIGDGTTTSLMGMAGTGPLVLNDMLAILIRVSPHVGQVAIHSLAETIRERRTDASAMYSETADFELSIARICVAAGDIEQAEDCWATASLYLGAYGGHKDPTIGELIDSIDDLASADIDAALSSLVKVRDLAYLVRQHTDGRDTSHFPQSWWNAVARVDPAAAARDAANLLLTEPGFEDARAHAAHETLLTTQVHAADPIVLAALRLTVSQSWRRPDTDLAILNRLAEETDPSPATKAAVAAVANNVAASYDDQPLMHTSDMSKAAATRDLIGAVQRLGGGTFDVRTVRPRESRKSSFDGPHVRTDAALKRIEARIRPELPSGANGAVVAAREYARKDYSDDSTAPRWNLEALTNAIGWRLMEVTLDEGEQAGRQLLADVARELPLYSDAEVLAMVADGVVARCVAASEPLATVASYASALAFTRIRGSGGWRTFAGREHNRLWQTAMALNPSVAEEVLASAIADIAAGPAYRTYGVTESVIAAFATQPTSGPGGTAIECWNAAFAILDYRLPGEVQQDNHRYTPTTSPDHQDLINGALATLAVSTIAQPDRSGIRRALLATSLLIISRPKLAESALLAALNGQLDPGRLIWLLETARGFMPDSALTPPMGHALTELARCDLLAVRVLAADILEAHGLEAPNPPATAPDIELRLAVSTFLGGPE